MRVVGVSPSGGMKPTTPTIGTATDGGTGTTVSVAFTPSTYIGKSTITYTATSSPGSLTATGSSSPLTVTGLTTGTAYTFTVTGNTAYGVASNASAASNSVTPASPSSYESIATATGTGSSGTITFSSIPSTYKALQIRFIAKSTTTTSVNESLLLTFNGSSAANYAEHYLFGNGTTASASGASANTFISIYNGAMRSNATYANMMGVGIIDIIDYASTSKNKTVRYFCGNDINASASVGPALGSGLWVNTSAISSLTLTTSSGSWATTTSIALYGIK